LGNAFTIVSTNCDRLPWRRIAVYIEPLTQLRLENLARRIPWQRRNDFQTARQLITGELRASELPQLAAASLERVLRHFCPDLIGSQHSQFILFKHFDRMRREDAVAARLRCRVYESPLVRAR
jgi:hypothetical protein